MTDLGASWIHGITDSAVYAAAQAFGLPTVEFTVGAYQPDSRPITYYGPDGARLSEQAAGRFVADLHAVDAALVRTIADAAPGSSYADVVEATLAQQGWDAERTERVREYLRHRSEEQYGVWIEDLDAHGLDDDAVDGDEVVFPRGYDELATHLATGLEVRLEHVVERVEWSEAGVRIVADQGVLAADRAVLTVPIRVLKSAAFTIDPRCPSRWPEPWIGWR